MRTVPGKPTSIKARLIYLLSIGCLAATKNQPKLRRTWETRCHFFALLIFCHYSSYPTIMLCQIAKAIFRSDSINTVINYCTSGYINKTSVRNIDLLFYFFLLAKPRTGSVVKTETIRTPTGASAAVYPRRRALRMASAPFPFTTTATPGSAFCRRVASGFRTSSSEKPCPSVTTPTPASRNDSTSW